MTVPNNSNLVRFIQNLLFFVWLFISPFVTFSQGLVCLEAQEICPSQAGNVINFPATVDGIPAEVGNNYGCLATQPNPAWYYIQVGQPGSITIDLFNSLSVDIDFALWGPFTDIPAMFDQCGMLPVPTDCSYSGASFETVNIPESEPGDFYLLLITNFSNQPTEIMGDASGDGLALVSTSIPDILPLSSVVCPATSTTTICQRVCAFSSVVYQVENNPTVVWEVIGAESYVVQGNSLTVNWGAAGSGEIYGYTPNNDCQGDAFLCVDIIPTPKATFVTEPPSTGNSLSICKGQTVQFFNNSTDATAFAWDFGDLSYSDDANPEHTFNAAGDFVVKMIARNACNCADTTNLIVMVQDAATPPIECISSICVGETATYTSPANCSTYLWEVSNNGVITAGGTPTDDFITVEWVTGPDGEISLKLIGCNQNFCDEAAVIPIPIIADDVTIKGPDKVCQGELSVYSIPEYNGVDVEWSVSNLGTIVGGQGTSTVTIEWLDNLSNPTPQWVSVDFENCYLGCGGNGFLEVFLIPEFYISGAIEGCENTITHFDAVEGYSSNNALVNWKVRQSNGQLVWESTAPTTSADVSWDFGTGVFTIHATPAVAEDYCTDEYVLFFDVSPSPPPVSSIVGQDLICPGEYYSYEVNTNTEEVNFVWEITNGTEVETKTGEQIYVVWGENPPYQLSLRQVNASFLPCESDPVILAIAPITTFEIEGATVACIADLSNFSINTPFENLDYNWSIQPSDAGAIIAGQNTETIQIFWYTEGTATLNLEICGVTESKEITVVGSVAPDVISPDGLCASETGTATAVGNFATYQWINDIGQTISFEETATVSAGSYKLEVTDMNGCQQSSSFTIVEFPEPTINITVPAYLGICPDGPGATIFALENEAGYVYEWFFKGVSIGNNNPELFVNEAGEYLVEVTNVYGCKSISNTITINSCADVGGFCNNGICSLTSPNCNFSGNINFTVTDGQACFDKSFINNSFGYIPGSLQWSFGDGTGSTDENPTHTYAAPGHYTVILQGLFEDLDNPGQFCGDGSYQDIEIIAQAEFESTPACLLQPTQFYDLSTFLPDHGIQSWQWNFGEPASGVNNVSNLQNPTHIYNSSGTFLVTLTIVTDTGCESTFTQTIAVATPPFISFGVAGMSCTNQALQFVTNAVTGTIEWDFGDPSSGNANNSDVSPSYHVYDTPGNYNVTMSVTSANGCVSSFSQLVTIGDSETSGNITNNIPSPICEGATIELTAPAGGVAWNWNFDNLTTETISTDNAGLYRVTVTDAAGCTYEPPVFPVEVLDIPLGTIRVIEFDDFGQPTNYFTDFYELCEGEEMTIEIAANGNYSYEWSTGDTSQILTYDISHDTTLVSGSYTYDVTITDEISGCTATVGPMNVEVHPFPADVQITSDQPLPVCEYNLVTLSVVNPNPDYDYFWNTGEEGTSIEVLLSGEYYVRAANQHGCIGESNILEIQPAPNIQKVPAGCLMRCNPDTICLPDLPEVVSFQWYLDGNPIGNPLTNDEEFIATESGSYYVEMTDTAGCTSTSEMLNLELFNGFGDINGTVYFDINENGVVDAGDTLVFGTSFNLLENGTTISTLISNENGQFSFENMPAANYVVQLDTTSLQFGQGYMIQQTTAEIVGCDQLEEIIFLLIPVCIPKFSTEEFTACTGESILYQNEEIPAGTTQEFIFPTFEEECDSTVTVTVFELERDSSSLLAHACEGTMMIYNGTPLAPETQTDFIFTNQNGCDSVMTIIVEPLLRDSVTLNLQACEGSTIEYQNTELMGGDQMDFMFTNADGCDSVVTVLVEMTFGNETVVNLTGCEEEIVNYQGLAIAAGTEMEVTLSNQNGCDSVVLIQVEALLKTSADLTIATCPNTLATFENIDLEIGTTTEFTFTNYEGCDSLVQVTVEETPPVFFDLLTENSCESQFAGAIEVINVDGLTPPYTYSIDGINFQNSNRFDNLFVGAYSVTLEDGNGCQFNQAVAVENYEPLEIDLRDAVLDCDNPIINLQPEILAGELSGLSFMWSDSSQSNSLTVTETGDYWVDITNICGTQRYEVAVDIGAPGRRKYIHLPNTFSPNNDGVNDYFQAFATPEITIIDFEMKVFDRWGNFLFETYDINGQWDGYFRNELLNTGVYVWFIKAKGTFCEREFDIFEKGDVLILK